MKKTAEEILNTYESFRYSENGCDETHYYKDNVLLAMEQYASQSKPDGMGKLFEYLAEHGGSIISSNDLPPELIDQARTSNRMYVDENLLGYIWEPPIAGRFPENEAELKMFDWCYPIQVEMSEEKCKEMLDKILSSQSKPDGVENFELAGINTITLDIQTLRYIKFLFDLQGDSSANNNGYKALCNLVDHGKLHYPYSSQSTPEKVEEEKVCEHYWVKTDTGRYCTMCTQFESFLPTTNP